MATVYRKTAKGQREIETRENRLAPRLRTALILIDGRRDSDDLAKLFAAEAAATLQSLLGEGYIEAIGSSAAPRPAAGARADVAAEPPPAAPAANPRAFEQRRREAVRHLTDRVGPMGEAVAIRIEKCTGWDELLPVLQLAQQVLRNTRGAGAAAEFSRLFIDTPPA